MPSAMGCIGYATGDRTADKGKKAEAGSATLPPSAQTVALSCCFSNWSMESDLKVSILHSSPENNRRRAWSDG